MKPQPKYLNGFPAYTGTVTVYLLHFEEPYKHARHYIGVCTGDANRRIEDRAKGKGANLVRVVNEAGIKWHVAKVWENVPRYTELKIKARGGAAKHCPMCKAERRNSIDRGIKSAQISLTPASGAAGRG